MIQGQRVTPMSTHWFAVSCSGGNVPSAVSPLPSGCRAKAHETFATVIRLVARAGGPIREQCR